MEQAPRRHTQRSETIGLGQTPWLPNDRQWADIVAVPGNPLTDIENMAEGRVRDEERPGL